jgi:glyoxylase-like metal-dependent hydrolase (beta-lactamase superfamily II)
MRDCYPADWIRTLEAAERLDFETVVGGHGDVLRGKSTLKLWENYFSDLLERAARAFASGESLEETRKQLVPALITTYGNRFPQRFSETVVSNVEKAYRYAGGSTN